MDEKKVLIEYGMSLNDVYVFSKYLVGFAKSLCEMPVGKQRDYKCAKCGSNLTYAYLENRVYLITCGECEITSLVTAGAPASALNKVGVISREI